MGTHTQRHTPRRGRDRQIAGSLCSSYSLSAMGAGDMILLRAAAVVTRINYAFGNDVVWSDAERILADAGFPAFDLSTESENRRFIDPDRRVPELLRQAEIIDGYVRSQFLHRRPPDRIQNAYASLREDSDRRSPVFYRWLGLTLDVGEPDPQRLLQGYGGETDAKVLQRFIDSHCYRSGSAVLAGRADVVGSERLTDVWLGWCAEQNLLSNRVTVASLLKEAGFTFTTSGEGRATITTVNRLSLRASGKRPASP